MPDQHSEKLGEFLCDPTTLAKQAYFYARNVIKGRWPEAEPFIMPDPLWAYVYARYVIGARWPEAEPFIRRDNSEWVDYCWFWRIKEGGVDDVPT